MPAEPSRRANPEKPPGRRWRRLAVLGIALVAAWIGGGGVAAFWLTSPPTSARSATRLGREGLARLGGESIEVRTKDQAELRITGTLVHKSAERAVVLVPGYGGDRHAVLALAELYLARGWSTLLIDPRGTGTSDDSAVGFGYIERHDLLAWVAELRHRGFQRIGLHGISMGAATIAFAAPDLSITPAFTVLQSCYADLWTTLCNRLPWLPLPELALAPVAWFGSARIGAGFEELRPVTRMPALRGPVLVAAGTDDPKVSPTATRSLFEALPGDQNVLLLLKGLGHRGLLRSESYRTGLTEFLTRFGN